MNPVVLRRSLIAIGSVTGLGLIVLSVLRIGHDAPAGPEIRSIPAASRAAVSEPREFNFAELPEPRPLPEFRFENAEGGTLTIADFRGRLVLLNIWATWCGPCRHEMPTLERLQIRFGGPDFEVVALSIDRLGAPVVEEFYRELGLEALAIYVDKSGQATRALNVLGVPTTLLIDREGREIGRMAGPAEWDGPAVVALIKRHLNRPANGNGSVQRSLRSGRHSGVAKP